MSFSSDLIPSKGYLEAYTVASQVNTLQPPKRRSQQRSEKWTWGTPEGVPTRESFKYTWSPGAVRTQARLCYPGAKEQRTKWRIYHRAHCQEEV
jgi:hypothetical protein